MGLVVEFIGPLEFFFLLPQALQGLDAQLLGQLFVEHLAELHFEGQLLCLHSPRNLTLLQSLLVLLALLGQVLVDFVVDCCFFFDLF